MSEWIVVVPLIEEPSVTAQAMAAYDVKPKELLLVDNTPDGAYREWADKAIVRNGSGSNWGVSRSWNEGLDMGRDWTLILSSSVVLPFGLKYALAQLDEVIEAGEKWGVFTEEAFHAFALSRDLIDIVGRFDDVNFESYYEDNDYLYRMRLAGLNERPKVDLGADSLKPESVARALKRGLVRVDFGELKDRYVAKWGGTPGAEVFTIPYER